MTEMVEKSPEQNSAEAEVKRVSDDLGPFVVAADTTRMAMVFTDAKAADNPIVFANDSFLKLTGYTREEVLAKSFESLLAYGTDAATMTRIEACFGGRSESDPEIHYRRKDGTEFWADVFVSPVRDADGDIIQYFVSFVDLTRHKNEQRHCKMMIDELNHRVKNTLVTVQSFVAQTLRTADDPKVIRTAIDSRLFALARSHDLLTAENWSGAGLRALIIAVLAPFGVGDNRAHRVIVTGDDVRIAPSATLALGIALNELATNAVKYGALSNEAGSVVLSWTVRPGEAGSRLVLTWREESGPSVAPRSRKGFGSQVIERGLAHELGAAVDLGFPPSGVVCTIDMPADVVRG